MIDLSTFVRLISARSIWDRYMESRWIFCSFYCENLGNKHMLIILYNVGENHW